MYLKQSYDAEDICQTVFLKLLSEEYDFKDASHEKAWIIRTTINACKDHLRTSFWKRATDLENAGEVAAPGKPESELLDLVMTLPYNYRISIYLHYYEGYRVSEIATMLGKSDNTVSTYLTRGRKKLRGLLDPPNTQTNTIVKGVM